MSCPVCFNAAASDETVRASVNLGIFVLMGVTAAVLGGFARFIISIARRSGANVASEADLKVRLYDDVFRRRTVVRPHSAAEYPDVEAGLQARLPT